MLAIEKLKRDLREKGRTKVLQFLRYSRKDKEYGIETVLVIGLSDEELENMVKRSLRRAKRRGAIYFEGKFEDLPVDERQRIYNEAKRAVMRWFEVECEGCGEILDLFEDDVLKFKWKDEEEIQCRECFGNYGDDPINDELLAEAIKRHKPFFKRTGYEDVVIVAKEGRRKLELVYERKYPLSLQAIKQFGKEVK